MLTGETGGPEAHDRDPGSAAAAHLPVLPAALHAAAALRRAALRPRVPGALEPDAGGGLRGRLDGAAVSRAGGPVPAGRPGEAGADPPGAVLRRPQRARGARGA